MYHRSLSKAAKAGAAGRGGSGPLWGMRFLVEAGIQSGAGPLGQQTASPSEKSLYVTRGLFPPEAVCHVPGLACPALLAEPGAAVICS